MILVVAIKRRALQTIGLLRSRGYILTGIREESLGLGEDWQYGLHPDGPNGAYHVVYSLVKQLVGTRCGSRARELIVAGHHLDHVSVVANLEAPRLVNLICCPLGARLLAHAKLSRYAREQPQDADSEGLDLRRRCRLARCGSVFPITTRWDQREYQRQRRASIAMPVILLLICLLSAGISHFND